MIRISNVIKQNGNFKYYDTNLYYKNKRYNLGEKYNNLDIHSESMDINHIRLPSPIRMNMNRYLNGKKDREFTKSIIKSSKYDIKSIPTHRLDKLKLFDRIGLIRKVIYNKYDSILYDDNKCIYVGQHFNEYLFMSQINGTGIYFTTLEQLQKLYNAYKYSIMVYSPNTLDKLD
jgi:hypothetical protein